MKRTERERIITDLAFTARDRVRNTLDLTFQLLDDDDNAISGVLMVVAADLLNGAAHYALRSGQGSNKDEALARVLTVVMEMVATKKLRDALKTVRRK